MRDILNICKSVAARLSNRPVDQFEVYGISSINNELEVFNSNVESLSFSDTKGLGIRIFKNSSIGYAYSSNLEEMELDDCIDRAIENSSFTSKEEYHFLPEEKEFIYSGKTIDRNKLFSEKFNSFNTEDKIIIAKNLESIALKKDKRVKGVSDLIYDDSKTEVAIVNSLGLDDSYMTTSVFIYLNIISRENDDTSTGDYFGYSRDPSGLLIEDIAQKAVKRSVSLLGAKKIKSQNMDLVLDPLVSAQLLSVIAGVISADEVQKGKSLFRGKIGKKIFGGNINIIDDGTLAGGLASRPFDAEGVPKGRTEIFKAGVLKSFLHNSFSARKDNCFSTGNAVRASYKSPPDIGASNFYIEPSEICQADVLKYVGKGFYVMEIIGLHSGINPISGQMSVGAKGFFINDGAFDFPIKEVTIATDILSFCKRLIKAGNDLKFIPAGGYLGSPSVVVNDITVSGD